MATYVEGQEFQEDITSDEIAAALLVLDQAIDELLTDSGRKQVLDDDDDGLADWAKTGTDSAEPVARYSLCGDQLSPEEAGPAPQSHAEVAVEPMLERQAADGPDGVIVDYPVAPEAEDDLSAEAPSFDLSDSGGDDGRDAVEPSEMTEGDGLPDLTEFAEQIEEREPPVAAIGTDAPDTVWLHQVPLLQPPPEMGANDWRVILPLAEPGEMQFDQLTCQDRPFPESCGPLAVLAKLDEMFGRTDEQAETDAEPSESAAEPSEEEEIAEPSESAAEPSEEEEIAELTDDDIIDMADIAKPTPPPVPETCSLSLSA